MKIFSLLASTLFFLSSILHAQSPSPVFQVNIPAEWPQSISSSSNITQALFEKLSADILGNIISDASIGNEDGRIVLPISSNELLNGKSEIRAIAFSKKGDYFMVESSMPYMQDALCYVFDVKNGHCVLQLTDVRQWVFSADDQHLLVTHANKWSVYHLPDGREVFTKPYFQEYYSNGFEYQQITSLGHNRYLIRESNEEIGNYAHIYHLEKNALQHSFHFQTEYIYNMQVQGQYLALTSTQNSAKDGTILVYDIIENKEKHKIKGAKLLCWAQHSEKLLFHDIKSLDISEFDLLTKKKVKRIASRYVGNVTYIHNDSSILVDPQAYSFDEGVIKIYNAFNGKLMHEIPGAYSEFADMHADYFVVYRFNDGYYAPILVNAHTFQEMMSMNLRDEMHLTKSGRYLMLEQYKSNLYRKNRFSIIDLHTNKQIVKFDDYIVPHAFEEEKGVLASISNGVVNFYTKGQKEVSLMLAVNDEGWLCFDRRGRYDCSRSFNDRIYYSCTAYDYQDQAWPRSHFNKQMHITDLWKKLMDRESKPLGGPEMKGCEYRELGGRNYVTPSDESFIWASLEQQEMASVNFTIDSDEDIIDFGNFSGKPVTVHKSDISYQCDVWNENNSALLFSFYADHFGGYLALAPDGYFSQSGNFKGRVALSIDGKIYDMLQLFDRYYRPDIIEGMLVNTQFSNRPANNISKGIQVPPRLELYLDENGVSRGVKVGALQNNTTIGITMKAINQGGGIKGLRLSNNGKFIGEFLSASDQAADSMVERINMHAEPGINYIELIGLSSDGTESKPLSLIYENAQKTAAAKPSLHVLSIGINAYRNKSYQLQFCVNDMREFTDSLLSISDTLFEQVRVSMLEDEQATREHILAALNEISKTARSEDVFVFYFAGHGIALEKDNGSEFYFIAHEVTQMTDPQNCALYGISGLELQEKLRSIPANKQVSFIDACNSGALAAQFTLRGPRIEKSLAQLSRSTGTAIYASTTSEQYAAEYKEIGHGVFTYVLLDALSGASSSQNCEVTAAGLKQYIDGQIPELIEQLKGNRQYPITFLFGQDFPIGFRCRE